MVTQDEYITQALAVQGGHLAVGRGGFSLHFKRGATLSGYDAEAVKTRWAGRAPLIPGRSPDHRIQPDGAWL